MKKLPVCLAIILLSACGKSETPPALESVETLVANPDRLKDLRAQCKADHARVGDAQCNAVAEATRRRFLEPPAPAKRAPAPAPTAASPSRIP